jgi:hypothetical protein
MGQLFQSGQSIAQHGMHVEAARWLIQCPQGLHVIRIQLKQLLDKPLGYLGRSQIHPIQGTEQRQQFESCGLQSWTQIRRYLRGCAARHSLSMAQRLQMVNGPGAAGCSPAEALIKGASQAREGIRMRSSNVQLSFNSNNRSASRRRAPDSLQRMPACRNRA